MWDEFSEDVVCNPYTKRIRLNKAGECLKYGLGQEWDRNRSKELQEHLAAFLVYFVLKGMIDRISFEVIKVYAALWKNNFYLNSNSEFYKEIAHILVKELRQLFSFSNAEEMFAALDEVVIPDWAFTGAEELMNLLPDAYLVQNRLYFIMTRNGSPYFRCVHTQNVGNLLNCSEEVSVPWEDICNCTISKLYSKIIGFNEEKKVLYLQLNHSDRFYAGYYIDEKQEVIYPHRCLGLIGNMFPIINDGESLSVVVDGKIRQIKKADCFEKYEVKGGRIYVKPTEESPVFFRPYRLMIDGTVDESAYAMAAKYLMGKVEKDLQVTPEILLALREAGTASETHPAVDALVISLEFLKPFIEGVNLEVNRMGRMYHFLCRLLGEYFSDDEDLLDYFYMFAEVSRRLQKRPKEEIVTERLYWKLNELNLSGKLKNAIHEIDSLKELLLEDAYWDDEQISAVREEMGRGGNEIGCFSINDNTVIKAGQDLSSAAVVGNSLVMREPEHPGLVSFNLETGIYEIRYYRILDKQETDRVIDAFGLKKAEVRIYTDARI